MRESRTEMNSPISVINVQHAQQKDKRCNKSKVYDGIGDPCKSAPLVPWDKVGDSDDATNSMFIMRTGDSCKSTMVPQLVPRDKLGDLDDVTSPKLIV